MSLRRVLCRCAAAVLLLWPGPGAAQEARGVVASTWQTTYGRLDLQALADGTVRGTYGDAGAVIGTLTAEGVIAAYWFEERPGRRCIDAERDKWYWGLVVWRLHPGGRLTGRWSFCDEPLGSAGAWHGTFVDGTTPLAVLGTDAPPGPAPVRPRFEARPADVTWAEASERLRDRLGDRRALDDPERLTADVTCDGGRDLVTGWTEPDIAGMRGFRLFVVHRRNGALAVVEEELPLEGDPARPTTCVGASSAPLGPRTGAGLLSVGPLDADAAALRGLPESCAVAIRLRDPLCGGGLDLYWSGTGILFEPAAEDAE